MITQGTCIYIQTNTNPFEEHLFIVINDPFGPAGEFIIVNFSTLRNRKYEDKTTIIRANQTTGYPTKDSYIVYSRSYITNNEEINNKINSDTARFTNICLENEILVNIKNGILKSERTPFEVQEFYSRLLFSTLN